MALIIETRKENGTTILNLTGRITLGDGSTILRAALHELLETGTKSLLLNLACVDLIDSSGLAEITSAHIYAERHAATLTLTNLDWNLQRLFDVTRLSTILHINQSVQTTQPV